MMAKLVALGLCGAMTTAQAADFPICWTGANGYTMTGQMRIDPVALDKKIVTEQDIVAFKIAGYHDGRLLGTWDMAELDAGDTWHVRFDLRSREFLTGGSFRTARSQGWNADGGVSDCGNPGFGFNSGNFAQDICVNGTFIADSSIPPDTPLPATACESALLMSKAPKTNHSD